jgi:CRP-like cAMP-binding protein
MRLKEGEMVSIEQLRDYPILSELTDADLAYLSTCLTKRVFAKGAYIFFPGNPGSNTYLVESGLVRLFFTNASGQEYLLNLVNPREVFGLPLLEDDQALLMGAAAYQPLVVLSIAWEDLLQLMDRSPRFMRNVYQGLMTSTRMLLMQLRTLVTLDLNGRLAITLLRLAVEDENQKWVVNMPLSQEELAGWLGASRGRLNQALSHFLQQSLIRIDGQKIVILDYPGLAEMTETELLVKV